MTTSRFTLLWWLLVFLWGWFFSCTQAQYYDTNTSPSTPIEYVYTMDDPLQNIISVLQRIKPLLTPSSMHQAAAAEDIFITIPNETIVHFLDESQTFDEFFRKLRISLIQIMIDNQYPDFSNHPYEEGNNAIVLVSWDFKVLKNIEHRDMLDTLLLNKIWLFQSDFTQIKNLKKHLDFSSITITTQEYQNLWSVFLFKTEQDLRDLWYELISSKSRVNTDPDYRRYNIKTAFSNIGNVRLIMPNEIFSLGKEFHYSASADDWSMPYVSWFATFGNNAKMVYGWWLCGVATAFFQGTLTNLWLDLTQYKAHSIYYRNLYEAEIDGITITDPGLDATVYLPKFDLKIQNIRPYPIITVFDFDGLSWSNEQMFTLSKAQDKWSFQYLRTYKSWLLTCFVWKINEENRTNCYRKVKNF